MPRVTELVGYGFAVLDIEVPIVDPAGNGHTTTQRLKKILFVDQQAGDQVSVSLTDEARQELVRQLTGGIQIPHVELP